MCTCMCVYRYIPRVFLSSYWGGGWREAEVKVNFQKEEMCSGIVPGTTKLTKVLEAGGSNTPHSFKVDQTPGEAGEYSE